MGGFSSEAKEKGEIVNLTLLERGGAGIKKAGGGRFLSAEDRFSLRIKNKTLKTVKDTLHCILKGNNNFKYEDKIISKLPQADLFSRSL